MAQAKGTQMGLHPNYTKILCYFSIWYTSYNTCIFTYTQAWVFKSGSTQAWKFRSHLRLAQAQYRCNLDHIWPRSICVEACLSCTLRQNGFLHLLHFITMIMKFDPPLMKIGQNPSFMTGQVHAVTTHWTIGGSTMYTKN